MPVEDVPDPAAGPRDIVLDVKACGICGSDLHGYAAGQFSAVGQVMGHEFSGEVTDVGAEVEGIRAGDRVTGPPIQPCGECAPCRAGSGHLCQVWTERSIAFGLPGAFAERVRIPDAVLGRNVQALPDHLTFEDGAFVEPLAVATHAVGRGDVEPGHAAVVLGLGTIGLLVAQVLLARRLTRVVGVDLSPLRRQVAEELGVIATDDIDAAAGQHQVDVVFEATGAPGLVQRAMEIVRPGGTVVIIALYEERAEIDPTTAVQKELTVRGSAIFTPQEFREALDLLASGAVRAQPLITHRHALEDLGEAFETQLDKDVAIKVMVSPSPDLADVRSVTAVDIGARHPA